MGKQHFVNGRAEAESTRSQLGRKDITFQCEREEVGWAKGTQEPKTERQGQKVWGRVQGGSVRRGKKKPILLLPLEYKKNPPSGSTRKRDLKTGVVRENAGQKKK